MAPATGVGTTRFCRTQPAPFVLRAGYSLTGNPPCDHLARRRCRVHRIPSRVRDDREAPLSRGDVASDSADLPDGLSETFFAEGLDSPNQFEMSAKISRRAHRIFDPIYGNHAPHPASLKILRLKFDWSAVRGPGEGLPSVSLDAKTESRDLTKNTAPRPCRRSLL